MKAKKGDLVTLTDGAKFIVVETFEEDGSTAVLLSSEDGETVNYCIENMNEAGQYELYYVTEEEDIQYIAMKFDEIFKAEEASI